MGRQTRKLLPGERRETWIRALEVGVWREMSSCEVLEVELVTYCCVINPPKTLWLKTYFYDSVGSSVSCAVIWGHWDSWRVPQMASSTWLAVDAGCQLGVQLGLLAGGLSPPPCGLPMRPGLLIAEQLTARSLRCHAF